MLLHKYYNRIVLNPKILVGKPVIKGTRISVELILKLLAQGMQINEILEEYPRLNRQDILAAMDYAYDIVENEEVHLLRLARVWNF